jgi:hypothetical protein
MASFSAITGVGTLVAGLAGGALATVIAGAELSVGPIHIVGLAFLFVLSSLMRMVMVGVFWKTL